MKHRRNEWRFRPPAKDLQPGDTALTDYETKYGCGYGKAVQIVARKEGRSQSGILYQVTPALRGNPPDEWFDAGWFTANQPPDQQEQA